MRKQYNKESHMDYQEYLKSLYGEDNGATRKLLLKNMRIAIRDELTHRQMMMVKLYYLDEMTMEAVGRELGVNKSTVSRTLKRSRNRLQSCLKYGAAETLNAGR